MNPFVLWLVVALLVSQCFDFNEAQLLLVQSLITVSPDRVLSVFLACVFLFSCWRPSARGADRKGILSMAVFGLLCTVSWAFSGADPLPSGRYRYLNTLFNFVYVPFLLYLLMQRTPYDRRMVHRLLVGLGSFGVYLVFTGIFEHYEIRALVWPTYILDPNVGIQFGRSRGPFASSSAMGAALVVVFLIHALLAEHSRGMSKLGIHALLILNIATIYFTDHRSVWLALGLVLIMLGLSHTSMRGTARIAAALVLFGFSVGVGAKFSWSDTTLFSRRQETVHYRLENYKTLLNMAKAHPWFGIGYGNFNREWPNYVGGNSEAIELTDGNHNTFLGILAETGLPGLLAYLAVLYQMARIGWLAYRQHQPESFERALSLVFLGTLANFFLQAQFSDYRSTQFINSILFTLFGIVTSLVATGTRSHPQERHSFPLYGRPRSVATREGMSEA